MRREPTLSQGRLAAGFVLLAMLCLPFADLSLGGHDPWDALGRMALGFLHPDFAGIDRIGRALALTVAFAIAGVALGGLAGLVMAPFYHRRAVRTLALALRSVHELFWALLLIQVLGIGPASGVLALALPYAGIFAKVLSELLDEADPRPASVLGPGTDALTRFVWARAPLVARDMAGYALYRVECGLRSSAVLGFVGLPTLGFQLDTAFRQGDYGAASAILILYVVLIAGVRVWMRPRLAPFWLAAALIVLSQVPHPPMGPGALMRFLTEDIVPAPIRQGDWAGLLPWLGMLMRTMILPGLAATLVVAQIALVVTGVVALIGMAWPVPRIAGRIGGLLGHLVLVILRSLPEYMLAYMLMQAFGPSMLPAVLALGLHNGAIIAHLLARQAMGRSLRPDAPRGLTLWAWEYLPRLFGPFLALALYRWEIILRETAIMGVLGIATLGFHLDDAISELRMDRAMVILLATGLLCGTVETLSRRLRAGSGTGAVTMNG